MNWACVLKAIGPCAQTLKANGGHASAQKSLLRKCRQACCYCMEWPLASLQGKAEGRKHYPPAVAELICKLSLLLHLQTNRERLWKMGFLSACLPYCTTTSYILLMAANTKCIVPMGCGRELEPSCAMPDIPRDLWFYVSTVSAWHLSLDVKCLLYR